MRHQPRKTHWRVALHPPSTTLPSGAWSPLARVRPDARRRPRRRVATGLERTRLRRPRQSRSGANGRRPPGPTPATGAAPAQRGAAPARTFTDASPTRTSQPHLAAAAPTRRGAAEHLPAPRGPTTRTAAPRTGRVRPARPGPARGAASAGPGQAGPASLRTILYLQRDSNTSLHTHHASPAASSPPGPGATAIRNPTGCPAGSWFVPARWAPRQLSGRGQSDRGPERVAPPAQAQRRSGTLRLPSRAAGIRLVPGPAQGLSLRTARPQL